MLTIILIIALSVFCIISVYNFFTAPVLKKSSLTPKGEKLVSVLVPARNEEKNISDCIKCIINQDYKNIEVIILDDNSTDNTYKIVSEFVNSKIKMLQGEPLPQNWLGKNWACHQLSQQANGEYFLFIDADVELKENVISSAVWELENSNAVLLSIFPTQKIKTLGEHLIVPLMNWLLLTFLPLKFVYSSRSQSFVAANGQFMLWRKTAYQELGGHQTVKNKVVEDMELARLAKRNNLKIKTILGGNLVFCRMYNSFDEAYYGFQKNFYPGFSVNYYIFTIIILFIFIVFTFPILIITNKTVSWLPVLLILVSRITVSIRSTQNWIVNILLHPLQMVFMLWIGFLSIIRFKKKSLVWKSRNI